MNFTLPMVNCGPPVIGSGNFNITVEEGDTIPVLVSQLTEEERETLGVPPEKRSGVFKYREPDESLLLAGQFYYRPVSSFPPLFLY